MLSQVYSKSNIMKTASLRVTARNVLFDRLLPLLVESADAGEAVCVFKLSYAYSMDSFMAFQFGLKLGSNFLLDPMERDWYMDAFFGRREWYFWFDHFPGLIEGLRRLGVHVVPKWISAANEEAANWTLRKCDRAEEMLASGEDLASGDEPSIYAQERAALRTSGSIPESKNYPYSWELASEMFDHSAAAMETSGDTLTYVFYELSRRPELQKELRENLLQLDPPLRYPLEGDLPDFKVVDAMPLLSAILQETLRRWPAVPGGQPRVTPPPGCSLAGYDDIPANVKVHSSANVLHRNPDVFLDPEEWNPDRWFRASEKQASEMNRWFWAWSSGGMLTAILLREAADVCTGRMCLGNNFATNCRSSIPSELKTHAYLLAAMKLVIAAVYSNFTTSIVDAQGIEQDEGFTAGPKGNKLLLQFHRIKLDSLTAQARIVSHPC